jgi:TetR/AcrR family transcriptional regulator, transcriptional repressor for nem operon
MSKSADTRVRLLAAAYSLILRKGYPATSVDEICHASEVSKGSFYHFFKSKESMALAVLEHHMAEAKQVIEKGLDAAGLDGAQRAIRYVKHVEDSAEELWRDGCLIGSLALELAETHPDIRERISEIFRDLTDHFEKVFLPLCQKHAGPHTPPPRELAEQFIVVIEGGVVLSRAHYDQRYISGALRCFRRYLETIARDCEPR